MVCKEMGARRLRPCCVFQEMVCKRCMCGGCEAKRDRANHLLLPEQKAYAGMFVGQMFVGQPAKEPLEQKDHQVVSVSAFRV